MNDMKEVTVEILYEEFRQTHVRPWRRYVAQLSSCSHFFLLSSYLPQMLQLRESGSDNISVASSTNDSMVRGKRFDMRKDLSDQSLLFFLSLS